MDRLHLIPTLLMLLSSALGAMAGGSLPRAIRQGDDLEKMVWTVDSVKADSAKLMLLFKAEQIADTTFARMAGKSYPAGCPVNRNDLRYLIIPHFDGHGNIRIGEMVCNRAIATDLLEIFKELFTNRYPIERMRLIDDFDGDDEASMKANNTSCFNYRHVAGSRTLSHHARGMAVDINPFYNPMVSTTRRGSRKITPAEARPYADRTRFNPYAVRQGDKAWKAFRRHGFSWGGSWRTKKDYQHFQKR